MSMVIKQVIVVRTDLDMGKGKIWFSEWWGGQEKVVLKVLNLKELEHVKQDAIEFSLPWSEVTDAGHTQIAPGTITCISIGPAPEEKIDKITGDLKLL